MTANPSSQPTQADRRNILKGGAAIGVTSLAGSLAAPAFAATKKIKIGLVMPLSGPLAAFSEHVEFVNKQVMRATGGSIMVNGSKIPFEIFLKDSQSNANRASEVASELIVKDKCHIIAAAATPETTNPVADQCELNGVPCITNDTPIEPHFFGRGGDPKEGFEWTNHFFFSGAHLGGTVMGMFNQVKSNKKVAALWPNDSDGNAFANIYPPALKKQGFSISDPGRFDMPMDSFAAAVNQFKKEQAELVFGVMPPPEFVTFWNEAAQQDYKPKVVFCGKTGEFPVVLESFGDRALGICTEIWWAPVYPYSSSLTGQSSAELAAEYEKLSGRQWSMPLGFRHALMEVVLDVLKRTEDIDKPESIQKAANATDLATITGPINFKKGPFPNTCATPTTGGQWVRGTKHKLELMIVENSQAPQIALQGKMISL